MNWDECRTHVSEWYDDRTDNQQKWIESVVIPCIIVGAFGLCIGIGFIGAWLFDRHPVFLCLYVPVCVVVFVRVLLTNR